MQDPKDRPVYGVSGGGNQPRPGDRIPRGYGRFWTRPDLSQPDYSTYSGEDQILFKRMTVGLGQYDIKQIQVGSAVLWTKEGGIQEPFIGSQIEVLPPGSPSACPTRFSLLLRLAVTSCRAPTRLFLLPGRSPARRWA